MGGFGGVVHATPRRGETEIVPVRSEPAPTPRVAHAGLYRVSFPLASQDQTAASVDALELLAPGVARLNAEIHVKFELRKPERAAARPTRRP